MCNYRHKYNCGTFTRIKKLTFMQGTCVGPKAVQVQGMVRNTRWGRQDICQKRLVWDSDGQELWSNKGERKVNGRPIDSQIDYVHKMGLINREMASRRKRPLWGTFRTGSVLAEPFGTTSKITSVLIDFLDFEL